MNTQTVRLRKWNRTAVLSLFTLSAVSASAQLFWDSNADTPGAGITPTGTWGVDNYWTTDPTGSVATGPWTPGGSAAFAAGSDATDYTVTIGGTGQSASSVTIKEGHVTFTGAQINIGAGNVFVFPGAKLSIPHFVGALNQSFVATAGANLYLDGSTLRGVSNGAGLTFLDGDFTINLGASGGIIETTNTGTNSTIFAGDIKGPGSVLVKAGTGQFRYQGAKSANATFSKLLVNEGEFRLGNVTGFNFETGFGAVPDTFTSDAITLNGGSIATSWNAVDAVLHPNRGITIGANGGTLTTTFTVNGAVSGSGPFTVSGGGTALNGLNTFNGGITITAGTTTIGALGGMIAQTIAGAGSLTVNGIVSGGTITKNNTGTLTLNGANTYTGPTLVNAGILNVGHAEALGTTGENTQVASGAELRIDGATKTFTINEPVQIAGTGAGGGGAITIQNSATPTLGGPITLTADSTVTVSGVSTGTFTNLNAFTSLANQNLTLQGGSGTGGGGRILGAIALGSGGLTKLQGGKWTLSGANSYTGPTAVNAGTLQFATKIALYGGVPASWTPTNITVSSGATLALNVGGGAGLGEFNATDVGTIAAMASATGGFLSGSSLGLDTSNAGGSFTYSANIVNPNGGANSLGVTKLGSGTLVLSGNSTYTGNTTVGAGGTLRLTGSLNGTAAVNVSGTLEGNGTITAGANGNVTLATGGKLSPGTGVGTLSAILNGTGTLDLTSGVTVANSQSLIFELGTLANSDRVTITGGALNLGTAVLEFDDFSFTALSGFGNGDYLLFDTSFLILGTFGTNLSGVVDGRSVSLQLADGGNDLILHVVPEPGSVAIMMGGLAVLMSRRKRR